MTAKERKREEKILKTMELLGCTREEAEDVYETDEIIDKGGRTKYDLPIDQEKAALKIGRVDERKAKSENNMRGKVRAENPTKNGIITNLAEFLTEMSSFLCENVERGWILLFLRRQEAYPKDRLSELLLQGQF